MAKTFIYKAGNVEAIDNEAFGLAWITIKEVAKKNHLAIYRIVVSDDETRKEFFANGGIFLNMRFFALEKLKIF